MASRLLRGILPIAGVVGLVRAFVPRRPLLHEEAIGSVDAISLAQTRSHRTLGRREPCNAEAVCVELHDRLGNNLYQFERALWVASQLNFCFVTLPLPVGKNAMSAVVATPEDGVVRLHPEAPNLTRAQVFERCSVSCMDCAPARRAAAQKKRVCHEWGPCDIGKRKLERPTIQMLRSTVQESVVAASLLRCNASAARLPADTVVMHMRSGDTLDARSGFYPLPPCAFYAAVMRNGNQGGSFPRAVVVTEPDLQHPCIQSLQAAFPGRVRVQSASVAEDACTVASAQNVAISFGTWGPSLSRLNVNLRNLYVPFGEDGVTAEEYGGSLGRMARHWFHQAVYEDGMPYQQHVYSFPGFHCEWAGRSDHFSKLLRYDESRVVVRSISSRII
mmetsp:Transcript_37822/g.102350  ORF Transcript_37822/g.102350 Transcript_37822/m.102350 type:complete len:389 (-) Transcript_37822:106-1272(-)